MEKSGDDFEKWLPRTVESFAHLPSNQQKLTVVRLIDVTDQIGSGTSLSQTRDNPQHWFFLMQSVLKILHVDYLSLLPIEVNEIICSYIDGKSLLKACNVSQNWNRIISSLQKIWQAKCTSEGFQEIAANDWKIKYVEGLRLLDKLKTGRAMVLQTLPVSVFGEEAITCLSISGGWLYASAGSKVSIWQVAPLKETPVVHFITQASVSCLCVYDLRRIACGHTSGNISMWLWELDGTVEETGNFVGHAAPVSCLAVDKQLGIVASGGWEGFVKLWCLHCACLLLETDELKMITQVSILRVDDLNVDEFGLLLTTECVVKDVQCVIEPREVLRSCEYCNTKEIVVARVALHLTKAGAEIITPCLLVPKKLIFILRSGSGSEMVIRDLRKIMKVTLDGAYSVLAVGKIYALLLSENRISHFSFALFNLKERCMSASWDFKRPLDDHNRHLFRVAAGNSLWLDDLGHLAKSQPVLACADMCNQIHIAFWES